MIEELLPPQVVAVDTREDWLDIELFPAELAAVGQAVEKRRREFITARACARRALGELGLPPSPIVNGERGEPRWPAGVVGSITHCAGYRGCALARAEELVAVGIDAEPNEPLPAGVLGEIARAEERPRLAELARAEPAVHWDRLLFSVKEAVYKVWFPLAHCWLGFEDATLTIDPAARTFQARLLKPWPDGAVDLPDGAVSLPDGAVSPLDGEVSHPKVLEGRWLARDGLVLSAIALPHIR